MEIEKKYLLDALPFDLSGFEKREITQGYICVDPVVRLRRADGDYFLTVKGKGRMVREEFELPLTRAQFEKLWKKVETRRVEKTRYRIPIGGGLTAELDVYKNELRGLLSVEVEFATVEEAERFTPPPWFGRDVTSEKRFKNSSLSVRGLPDEAILDE